MANDDERPATKRRETDGAVDNGSLHNRLKSLEDRLGDARKKRGQAIDDPNSPENRHNRSGIAQAFRLSSEFIAGVVVGAGIGYLVDTFFGTSPWGMIVFFLLGFAAAILNVLRAAGMVAESGMRLRPAQELHKSRLEGETDRTDQK